MSNYWLVIIPVAFVVILTFIALYRRQSGPSKLTAMESYVDGLRLLTAGDEQNAFIKFRQAVDQNTENIDAYLKMGDIFRNRGMIDKALQVHRELRLRQGLGQEIQTEIEKSLTLDYIRAARFDKANELLEKLVKDGHTKGWAAEKLLNLYIKDRKWKEACDIYENVIKKSKGPEGSTYLAALKIMVGRDLQDDDEYHKARIVYKEAISLDRSNPLPYLYIAESYIDEKRSEDGLGYLRKLCEEAPKSAHVGFTLIEDTLFQMGRFGEIEDIYRAVLGRDSANIPARLSLAEIYIKKGEISSAESLLRTILEFDPANSVAAAKLAMLMINRRRIDDGLGLLSELSNKINCRAREFKCPKCGKNQPRPLPLCPSCGTVGIFN